MPSSIQSRYEESSIYCKSSKIRESDEAQGIISLVSRYLFSKLIYIGLPFWGAFFYILPFNTFSSVIDYSLVGREVREFTFQEACSAYGYKNRPLIQKLPQDQLDCMNGNVDLISFCKKRVAVPEQFIRAIADEKKNKVICEQAKRVSIKIACDSKNIESDYCFDAKGGCSKLQRRFANKLPLQYSGLTEGNPKKLSCEFAGQNWLDSPLLKPMM